MLATLAYAHSGAHVPVEGECFIVFDLGSYTMDAAVVMIRGGALCTVCSLSEVRIARAPSFEGSAVRRRSLDAVARAGFGRRRH